MAEDMESCTPVAKKDLRDLKRLIKSESHRWFQLGFQMKLSMDELKKIEKDSGRKPPDICFLDVLNEFLNKEDDEKKWKFIFEALEDISNNRLKRKLESQFNEGDIVTEVDPNELAELLKDVTPNWYMFGTSLDIPTSKLQQIKDDKGPDICFNEMFQLWFTKDKDFATYEVLIAALESINNKVLARKVREKFLTDKKEPVRAPEVTWLTGVSEEPLTDVDDTTDVVEAIGVNVPNWEDLGTALKVKSPQMEAIKREHQNRVSDCRREVIKLWLKSGTASWKSLCIALSKDYVGHFGLAKKIAEDYRVAHPPIQSDHNTHTAQYNVSNERQPPISSSQEESSNNGSSKLLVNHRVVGVAMDHSHTVSHQVKPPAQQQPPPPVPVSFSHPIPVQDSSLNTSTTTTLSDRYDKSAMAPEDDIQKERKYVCNK